MKNFISILILLAISMVAFSQSTLKTHSTINITNDVWSFRAGTGDVGSVGLKDSIGVKQDSLEYIIFVNSPDSSKEEIYVKLTEIISPARVIGQYQVRRSIIDSWTTITAQSMLYTGVGTDTTWRIRNVAAYKAWPHKRILLITNSATKEGAYVSAFGGYFKK